MKLVERPLEEQAIYKIENLIDGKFYIGSTINAYERFCHHRTDLRRIVHSSVHLQNAWNKYGEDNFLFYVLEYPICGNRKELYEIEQYYIDTLKPEYNMSKLATGSDWNAEQRKQASIGQMGSKIKHTTKYRDEMSKKVSSLWEDSDYRNRMLSSMRSDSTRNLHKTKSAEVWTRDGMRDKIYTAKMESARQRGHICNGFPVKDVYKMRELYDSGVTSRELSSIYPSLPYSTLLKIVKRKTWVGL